MAMAVSGGSFVQAQLHEQGRVYDIVTDADTFYLFPSFKPCFTPQKYVWAPLTVMMQEYVSTDTVTVYGVAITVENHWSPSLDDQNENYNKKYRALLMRRLGPSPISNHVSMEFIDSVSFKRAHSRYCRFMYEDECDEKKTLVTSCYEFYFDTPEQINRMTDTFYVGRYLNSDNVPYFGPEEYGGEYSTSIPSTIYQSHDYTGDALDMFVHCNGYQDRKWGVAFPIIGFRCGPMRYYWLDSYAGDSAVVRWRSVEQGTLFNVRLTGNDGTDTTIVTTDTVIVLTQLSDSVRYNVMLRKQCHYCTSNYDTTVYGQWTQAIGFGAGGGSDTTGGGSDTTSAIVQARGVDFVLSPNPAHGTVDVQLPAEALGGRLTLCDLAGRELINLAVEESWMEIDISELPSGAYLVKLATAMGTVTKKLLVQ